MTTKPTYALFTRGDTTGIFQFESHGMRDILRRYQPTRLEDLTALNALYRPGPIQGGMIDDFIARKHGKKKVTYDLPALEEILSETWGVILYQEQVMQIANRLAGFSLGDADLLRRAMGKKKPEEMAAQREKFLTGCAARKVPAKKAEKIFDLMAEFAGYGFNKSHSCAYALLAYQTAWLKTHYPVEFMAAMLTSETGNIEKVVKYINEARSMSITVLPPDVNSSDVDFTPVGDQIRFGLRAIKNVGENTVKGILAARETLGRFTSFFEFVESVEARQLNKRVLESLIRAGAMDGLGAHRAQMIAVTDRAVERAQKLQRARESGQHGLFGGGSPASRGSAAGDSAGGRGMAGARDSCGGVRDARLLHLGASARQICGTLEGPERDGTFLDGREAQQRGHCCRRNYRAGAAHAFAARRSLGHPDLAGPHRA